MSALLEIDNLHVHFGTGARAVQAVRGVSFSLDKGETLALVGESGSGKSVTALSVLQLLPYPLAHHPEGRVRFDGQDVLNAPKSIIRDIRGGRAGIIFQEPLTSLNPLHGIGKQIAETLYLHRPELSKSAVRDRVVELLDLVGLSGAASRLADLPHTFSGGQRQRIMIAMALANDPDLLIADEPTTALDVTIQAQVLKLLKELQDRLGMALLLITHDLGIVRRVADRVCVMTQGEIVETGPTEQVFTQPRHAYTKKLLAAEPKGRPDPVPDDSPDLLTAQEVKVWFPIKAGFFRRTVDHVKAVDGVDIRLREGETLGVVGESGSGKSTLARALLRLDRSRGAINFAGQPIQNASWADMRPLRADMQIVFQDPFGSLSPRLSIAQIVGEGLQVHEPALDWEARRARVAEALGEVGLDPAAMDRYPHEFSGGQRQRVAVARALALKPRLIVLDEPTSALDMSVQAQIVDLLRDLQKRHKLTYLFISHDLKVVRALAHQIIVMRGGEVVEAGLAENVFETPQTAYTQALMAAAFKIEADETGIVSM